LQDDQLRELKADNVLILFVADQIQPSWGKPYERAWVRVNL